MNQTPEKESFTTDEIRSIGKTLVYLGEQYAVIAETLSRQGITGLEKPGLKSYKRAEKLIRGWLGSLRKYADDKAMGIIETAIEAVELSDEDATNKKQSKKRVKKGEK